MRSSLLSLATLVLVVSGCGEGAGEAPRRTPSFVRELEVQSDYGQIYIYDPATQADVDPATEEDDPLFRAMDDATESRRFVGYDRGLVDLLAPSQYNWHAPMRIEVGDAAPPLDIDAWDHVVEVPLPVPSGTLVFEASGGGPSVKTKIPPGTYRARLSGRGYVAGVGEIEGHESYRLQLWPAEESEPKLIKYWDGYDVVRPNG
jgi:hypothetical protein